ncbi:3-hydroxyacyl-CoA dehydrogenase [Aurantimonas aggregata]|uniref:3-hydroxyacyl-CoA dehydrogenase n=1 Tax=Aurantimonas aggregata TaxID=2047720 RepID=A0A6L9MJA3_9HYPH|nr:3-hydroxyacyl-CoA dehydrogenase [Aurantimonas aggregata]NDV87913.1 3-hydroxyacyl-CoA dehydrogenase [Aurantimonas aggregata]
MTISKTAIAGSGIIGSSWAIVYARSGLDVAIYDRNPDNRASLMARIGKALDESSALFAPGETTADVLARIVVHDNLEAALVGADFVHECIEEKLESKKTIFAEFDRLTGPETILATTTSSFPVSQFASDLGCRDRCIVVHPATPPHLLPVTEICAAPFTSPGVFDATFRFMERCGQTPVHIKKEIPSFVLNRMQAALVVEMFRCLNEDLISPADIDKIISQGFGLRWAFLGPFEGVDLNATGGIRQYLENFGFLFNNMANELGFADVVTPHSIDLLEDYTRTKIPLDSLGEKVSWRDQSIIALRLLKDERGTVDRA